MAEVLAPYACDPTGSQGRRHAEAAAPTRTEYQRDRDRIVHSSAFRRLVYKTIRRRFGVWSTRPRCS